jgi:hypothetical protein
VHGGVRTPKLLISTLTGLSTASGTILLGRTTLGFGHFFPGESSICSHIKAVLSGCAFPI